MGGLTLLRVTAAPGTSHFCSPSSPSSSSDSSSISIMVLIVLALVVLLLFIVLRPIPLPAALFERLSIIEKGTALHRTVLYCNAYRNGRMLPPRFVVDICATAP